MSVIDYKQFESATKFQSPGAYFSYQRVVDRSMVNQQPPYPRQDEVGESDRIYLLKLTKPPVADIKNSGHTTDIDFQLGRKGNSTFGIDRTTTTETTTTTATINAVADNGGDRAQAQLAKISDETSYGKFFESLFGGIKSENLTNKFNKPQGQLNGANRPRVPTHGHTELGLSSPKEIRFQNSGPDSTGLRRVQKYSRVKDVNSLSLRSEFKHLHVDTSRDIPHFQRDTVFGTYGSIEPTLSSKTAQDSAQHWLGASNEINANLTSRLSGTNFHGYSSGNVTLKNNLLRSPRSVNDYLEALVSNTTTVSTQDHSFPYPSNTTSITQGSGLSPGSLYLTEATSTPQIVEGLSTKIVEDTVVNCSEELAMHYADESTMWIEQRFIFVVIIGCTLSFLGILANLVLFRILLRKSFRHSTFTYLLVLAAFDIALLINYILLIGMGLSKDYFLSLWLHKLWYSYVRPLFAIGRFTQLAQLYLILAATFERFATATHITKRARDNMRAQRRRYVIIATMIVLALVARVSCYWELAIVYTNCTGFASVQETRGVLFSYPAYVGFKFYVEPVIHSYIPFILLLVLNVVIIRRMRVAWRRYVIIIVNSMLRSVHELDPDSEGTRGDSDHQYHRDVRDATLTTVIIVTCYLIANVVHVILTFLEQTKSPMIANLAFYIISADLSSFLVSLTCSIRLPLYYVCNAKIRHEVRVLFGLSHKRGRQNQDSAQCQNPLNGSTPWGHEGRPKGVRKWCRGCCMAADKELNDVPTTVAATPTSRFDRNNIQNETPSQNGAYHMVETKSGPSKSISHRSSFGSNAPGNEYMDHQETELLTIFSEGSLKKQIRRGSSTRTSPQSKSVKAPKGISPPQFCQCRMKTGSLDIFEPVDCCSHNYGRIGLTRLPQVFGSDGSRQSAKPEEYDSNVASEKDGTTFTGFSEINDNKTYSETCNHVRRTDCQNVWGRPLIHPRRPRDLVDNNLHKTYCEHRNFQIPYTETTDVTDDITLLTFNDRHSAESLSEMIEEENTSRLVNI